MKSNFSKQLVSIVLCALVSISAFANSNLSDENQFRAPAVSNWIVVVKDNFNAQDCARAIEENGARAVAVLPIIGAIVVENSTADSLFAEGLECVLSAEADALVEIPEFH